MNNVDVKAELVTDMNKYFEILNQLPLNPKDKLLIILKYIYSKLRWRFSITLQMPWLYIIQIQLLKSTPKDGLVYLKAQILDIFIFQLKRW